MTSTQIHPVAPTTLISAMAAFAILAAGCGDGPLSAEDVVAARTAATPLRVITPLIADDDSLMPAVPQSEPADPGARTRTGRYATAEQAAQLEQALQYGVVRVDAHDVGHLGVETVAGLVHGLQAARNLGHDAPVLVQGDDQRLAAALANRLTDDGLTRVWLVTR
jgi:hypothetical protein